MKWLRWVLIGLVLVVVLAIALLWLDFAIVRTDFRAKPEAQAYQVGTREGQAVGHGTLLSLYVGGGARLASELLLVLPRRLTRPLAEDMPFTEVARLADVPETVNGPVLIIEFLEQDVHWTPVYASAEIGVRVSYASDGATAWRNDDPVMIVGAADPTLRLRIDIAAEGQSRGLVSRPAYARDTAERLAGEISAALAEQLAAH